MHTPTLLSSLCAAFCFIVLCAQAGTVTYDFEVGWVNANPDGMFNKPTIGINGQWPVPVITATVGDRVIVNVKNSLGNATTSLHFHGIYQNGTNHMDGPTGVTQCSILPGASFIYDFTIDQPGTYWYHSHDKGQYPDGLRGALVVHDPESPYKGQYDEEIVLTMTDHYHNSVVNLLSSFINPTNPTGAEPVPDSALFNDSQNVSVKVEPGKTYLVRMINMAAFAPQYIWFEEHNMTIVEVDGIYTEPAEANMIYITPAQRYSVLITTKNDTSKNFAFVGSMDEDLFDTVPDSLNPNVTGWLVYDDTKELPTPAFVDEFDPFDDFTLVPQDGLELYDKVDQTITLNFMMADLGDGANYAFFNDQTYVSPKVPTLYSVLSSGADANNVSIYGTNTNAFVLQKDEVVEIVVNSDDPGKHPFHLHGHAFQAVVRADDNAGYFDPTNYTTPPVSPMRRDTFLVHPQSNIVLRFKANNPGVWLFHCHIEWHISSGLVATMIEAPLDIQKTITIPADHLKACNDANVPTAGNAAGNTKDLFDLTGENAPPGPLPDGFTAKGIVALVFSCLSAFLGMAVISWYGVGEISQKKAAAAMNEKRTGAMTTSSAGAGAGAANSGAAAKTSS